MRGKNFWFTVITALLVFTPFSCTDDEAITQTPVSDNLIAKAKEMLKDSIVLNATAMMGTVNKTCLDEGCPLKYYFSWKSSDTLNIQLKEFSVGNMPVTIWFSVNTKFMQLNTWEQDEYSEDGWVKFKGTSGITNYNGNSDEYEDGSGGSGSITGYYNAQSNEIEFVTVFNVMNMTCDVYQQTIDTTRIYTFDAEFSQYEEDLIQCKADNGTS